MGTLKPCREKRFSYVQPAKGLRQTAANVRTFDLKAAESNQEGIAEAKRAKLPEGQGASEGATPQESQEEGPRKKDNELLAAAQQQAGAGSCWICFAEFSFLDYCVCVFFLGFPLPQDDPKRYVHHHFLQ